MKKLLALSGILFFISTASAQSLLEGIGNMADPFKSGFLKIFSNLSSSSSADGIEEALSEQQCYEKLLKDSKERDSKAIHSVMYFLTEYSSSQLYDPYTITPQCKSNSNDEEFKLGLNGWDLMKINSMDTDSVISESRCIDYLKLNKVEVVKIQDAEEEKTCRRMSLSLRDKSFHSYFCVGDQRAYVDYHDYPAEVLKEIEFKK